jgi:inner membrane protein
MDSLTQAVFGSAVGEAVAGDRVGRRAALWGAVAGTLPDLDVLAYPFLTEAGALRFHRGLTHGLPFAFVAGPLLGWLVWRWYRWRATRSPSASTPRRAEAGALRAWTAVFFWGLLTHPLLDVFTVYGTQLLAPFSDTPFAVGSTFIIDPLVTVPLLGCLAVALATRRSGWAVAGIVVSTLVLVAGAGMQVRATETVEAALAERGVEAERVLVAAGPFTSVLWRGVAEEGDQAVPFWLHVADGPGEVTFEPAVPLATFPPEVAREPGAATLVWFSRGWLTPLDGPPGDPTAVADLRFGRAGLSPGAPFVFRWDVLDDGARIRQRPLGGATRIDDMMILWRRLWRADVPGPVGTSRRTTSPFASDSPSP